MKCLWGGKQMKTEDSQFGVPKERAEVPSTTPSSATALLLRSRTVPAGSITANDEVPLFQKSNRIFNSEANTASESRARAQAEMNKMQIVDQRSVLPTREIEISDG